MNEYSARIVKMNGGFRQITVCKNGKPIHVSGLSKFCDLSKGEQSLLLSIEDLSRGGEDGDADGEHAHNSSTK